MDRDRLKEVRQTDLTEGRINQDFLDWLRTKGTSWLLVVVVALFVYAIMIRWRNHQENYQTEAWVELGKASLPASYEAVAEKYSDVGAVAYLAKLRAAGKLLSAVQAEKTLSADNENPSPLTPEMRTDYLNQADRLFGSVAEANDPDGHLALIIANALNGRAAVAESKGNLDEARQYYNQAAQRVEATFPNLAEQSRKRAAKVDQSSTVTELPSREQVSAVQQKQSETMKTDPVWTDQWVTDILTPKN